GPLTAEESALTHERRPVDSRVDRLAEGKVALERRAGIVECVVARAEQRVEEELAVRLVDAVLVRDALVRRRRDAVDAVVGLVLLGLELASLQRRADRPDDLADVVRPLPLVVRVALDDQLPVDVAA